MLVHLGSGSGESHHKRGSQRRPKCLRLATAFVFAGHRQRVKLIALLAAGLSFVTTGLPAAAMRVSTLTPTPTSPQSGGPWTSFSIADGLAADSILALNVGKDDHLWVGTSQGMSIREPEGDWLTLTDADGLAGNIVMDIAPDPTDPQRRWFATYSGGSLLDDGGTPLDKADDAWVTFTESDGLVDNYLSTVAVDADSSAWFGTDKIDDQGNESGSGISVLDNNGTLFTKTDDIWITYTATTSGLSHNVIRDMTVDGVGVVWIATQSGLNAYSDGAWTTFYTSDGLSSNDVTALLSVDHLLWIGTKGGLGVLDCGATPHDKDDDQWVTFTQYSSGLIDNDISTLAVDGAGRIWIGTDQKSSGGEVGYGVSVLDASRTPFSSSDDTWATFDTYDGLTDNAVRVMAAVGSSAVWLGTKAGLSHLAYGSSPFSSSDDRWTTSTSSERLAGYSVYALAQTGPDAMWLGTDQGLSLLRYNATPHTKRNHRWTTYTTVDGLAADGTRALAVDDEGRVWIGTPAGLTVLDARGTPTYKEDDLSITYNSSSGLAHDQVNDIAIDSVGRAWIACGSYFGGGLHVLDIGYYLTYAGDDAWATFTPLNSNLPGPYVTAVALVADDDAWMGTHSGIAQLSYGGSPFDKSDDSWAVFTASNSGLADDTVRDIGVDQTENVWIGLATEGVSVYSHDEEWLAFTRSDGLENDLVEALAVDRAGNLWFGTGGGGASVLSYGGTLTDKSDDVWTVHQGGEELLSGNIEVITVDSWGQVWLGTFGGGASVYSTVEIRRLYLPEILRNA